MSRELTNKHVVIRPWPYGALVVAGLLLFVLAALGIEGDSAGTIEIARFRSINDLPDAFAIPIWAFMQAGNLLVIPLGVVVAAFLREFRLAGAFALAGISKYFAARAIKTQFVRHRPSVLIDDVNIRIGSSETGLGFVSGHATIAVAVAVIIHPYLKKPIARVGLWVVTVLVLVGRVYAGAHFPLDVVGGAGIGLVIGAVTNLIVGVPARTDARSGSEQPEEEGRPQETLT